MEQMAKGEAFHTVQISRISDLLSSVASPSGDLEVRCLPSGGGEVEVTEEGRSNFQHQCQ